MGLKREGEFPFPFLCFWFLLSHHKRNALLFLLEKEHPYLPLGRGAGSFLLSEVEEVRLCQRQRPGEGLFVCTEKSALSPAHLQAFHTAFKTEPILGVVPYSRTPTR